MRKRVFTLVLFACSFSLVFSQTNKKTTEVTQIWLGYFNQTRLSNKLGLWGDFGLRTKENFVDNFSQSLARVGLTYYLNDVTKLTAGYGYITHYPAEGHSQVSQVEHRPWQQIQWHNRYAKTRMMQWLRLEERYRQKILNDSTIGKGFSFNYKIRYNLFFEVPFSLKPQNKFSFVLNDEVHINFGKQVVYNYFDQNRFFVGFKYNTSQHDNLQLGYMNVFSQLASGNSYRNNHVIRLFYFQNLDLRKKDFKR
jgi:hypothetical protein